MSVLAQRIKEYEMSKNPSYAADKAAADAAMKAKQFGAKGSQEAATNKNNYYASGGNPTTGTNVPYSPSNPNGYMPNLYSPGSSAKQSASFNGSNFNDMSGVWLGDGNGGYNQATNAQAIGNNPLHYVNSKNNNLILGAIESGDWSQYDSFQAGQSPAWFTDGQKNKEYWGGFVERGYKSMNEQGISDTERARREADFKDSVAKMNAAPGMMGSLTSFANDPQLRAQYGIQETDSNWWNSEYNNSQVQQDGRFEQNMWYDNQLFKDDPAALSNAMFYSNNFGSPDEQKARQAVNSQYNPNQQQSQQGNPDMMSQMEQMMMQQQKEFQDYMAALEAKLKEQEAKNEYTKGEQTEANKGGSGNNGSHIFAPGTDNITSGSPGYTQSNNALNDLLYKYLDNNWQGGF